MSKSTKPTVAQTSDGSATAQQAQRPRKPAVIPDSALINIKSNVYGELFVMDRRSNEMISFGECGEVKTVSMNFLRNVKNQAISFFENQLFIIIGFADENAELYDVEDIYNALYVKQYYKNLFDTSDFSRVCSWSPDEIKAKVAELPKSVKPKLAVALNTYIEKGILDSLKAIKAFESALGCKLREPD